MKPFKFTGQMNFNLGLALIIGVYLSIVGLTFNQVEDDAFIYFRVAANLADGNGYVFNAGGEHIESGSSLLWQLMLVPACWLPLDMIISAKLLGIIFGCLALCITYWLSRMLISDSLLRFFPSLLLAVSAPFFCWSQRGLETPFYLCTLLGLCYVCLHHRYREYWYIAAILVFCSRPEGFVILLALIPYLLIERATIPRFSWGLVILPLACGAVTLGRLWYFHDPFPHPFYIKAVGEPSVAFTAVLNYFSFNYLAILTIPLLISVSSRRFWNRKVIYLVSFLAVTGIWAIITKDGKPYNRHLLPFLAFFFLASVASLDHWAGRRVARIGICLAVPTFAVVMLTLPTQAGLFGSRTPNLFMSAARVALRAPKEYIFSLVQLIKNPSASGIAFQGDPFFRENINTNYQATTGKFLQENYPENITIVYDQMGQTPWYAGYDKVFIDSFGLLTKATGYHSFHQRAKKNTILRAYERTMESVARYLWPDEQRVVTRQNAVDYLFNRQPELILVNSFVEKFVPQGLTAQIARDPRIEGNYTLAYIVNRNVKIYERKDVYSPDRTQIPHGATVRNMNIR